MVSFAGAEGQSPRDRSVFHSICSRAIGAGEIGSHVRGGVTDPLDQEWDHARALSHTVRAGRELGDGLVHGGIPHGARPTPGEGWPLKLAGVTVPNGLDEALFLFVLIREGDGPGEHGSPHPRG
jgi:hypothetical protein